MTDSHFKDGVQFAWDATSLSWIEKCPRYYQYSMLESWEPKNKSVHLLFGGFYASALERYHKLRAQGMSYDDATIEVVHQALIDTWEHRLDDQGNRIPKTGAPWMSFHDTKTRENLIRSIVWYLDYWQDDNLKTTVLGNGKPAVELSFSFEVDRGIVLSGHLDRVVTYGDDPYITDNKTTGSTLAPYYFDQYSPDTQMSLYTFAGRTVFNSAIKGIVIDAAQIAVGFTRFDRGFTFRTDAQLEEWYGDVLHVIDTAQRYTREGHFPMNPASCGNYGGCTFRHVCNKSPELRKNFLMADFKKREQWNPLSRR